MTQKLIKERLDASEAEIEAIKKEVQRIPVLEKMMERMHAMKCMRIARGSREDLN